MIGHKYRCHEESLPNIVSRSSNHLNQAAEALCLEALDHAKSQLHPLLRGAELNRLDSRCEFVQVFKRRLEQSLAEQLAIWQPCIQAVFKFDSPRRVKDECWDSTIHLLVLVAQPLHAMRTLAESLDQSLVKCLRLWHWSRFRTRPSIVKIHQITPDEVRRGMSYAALFDSIHTAPVKVWPVHGPE